MKQSKISEIFLSYQGEGPFAGSRQLFIRFYGCNTNCVFCDTSLESYKTFTKEGLLGKILDFEDNYNELTLTGGEPLLYADFLADFAPLFKRHRRHNVYLETNGLMPDELEKIIGHVDIIAMDFKLPSSTRVECDPWSLHERFIKSGAAKQLIVKAVITENTSIEDIKKMSGIIRGIKKEFTVILQPVTPVNEDAKEPDEEMISLFKGYMTKETGKDVRILGQVHKYIGIK